MVTGGTGGLLVPSPVICAITRHGRLLLVGRGAWWDGMPAGAFFCVLHGHQSIPHTGRGAIVVLGGIGSMQVPSVVLWTILPQELIFTMGRI